MSPSLTKINRFISNRVNKIPVSGLHRFFAIAAEMPDVISLGVGEPDFATPKPISEAGFESVKRGETGYTNNSGLLELRESISNHLQRLYAVNYDAKNEILITVGVSEALYCVMTAICDEGDEIIVPQPCFVSYTPEILLSGGVPVIVECKPENDFEPLASQIEAKITAKTKAILLGFPSNPTGAVLSKENALAIAKLAEKHDLLVISDEIYDRLVYGVEHICFAALPNMRERTILLGGFSKDYAMTGWRVGYICAEPEILGATRKVHQFTIMSAPTIGQYAALEALKSGEPFVENMHGEYARRRKLVLSGLDALGLRCFEPKGAFYAFPSVEKLGLSGDEFAEKLLINAQVAVVPGSAFGDCGKDFVRIAYCNSYENIEIALERIGKFIKTI
ncbi:MAG: aminotransferase class I/II-fold pyridoxal phosphate-dependent enzyme [Pyrinomonadaceae bacterium]|nr:aminotransferase class I/II-fold pyridoxal phosphate-dependent enzyme [Pyrinomonadaceae bacterium]